MDIKAKKDGKYEVVLSIVLFIIIIYFFTERDLLIKVAFAIGLISLISKKVTDLIVQLWQKVLRLVGVVNSHILLGVVFFLFLFPLSLLYRLVNKDILNIGKGKKSYYTNRNHIFTSEDLENPW